LSGECPEPAESADSPAVLSGRQSLLVVPEGRGNVPNKKAEIEMQSQQCTEHCDMLNKPQNSQPDPRPNPQNQQEPHQN
jgi:hypothetical protein